MLSLKICGIFAILFVGLGVTPAMADEPTDRVRQNLETNSTGGTVGLYLKEVNGPVLANYNEGFIFEPASTIKVAYHLNAMLEVEDLSLTLASPIDWFQDSETSAGVPIVDNLGTPNFDERAAGCPVDTGAVINSLDTGLRAMMNPSDNRWTQAFRVLLGQANVNDMMNDDLGMTNSLIQHRIGCAAEVTAMHNQLTLVDAGLLYEAVANGFLTTERDNFYEIMIQFTTGFNTMIDQEAVGLVLSSDGLDQFKAERTDAMKGGSYNQAEGQYRAIAGWAKIPFKNASCTVIPQEYVFGAFMDTADSIGPVDNITVQGVELFREQIRAALVTWADCETDLSIEKTGPSDPVVAGTQIVYTVTVDNLGPNDATNVEVIDILHPDLEYVSNTGGCVEAPSNTLTCDLGTILNGNSDSFDVTVDIPADLVYDGGTVVGNEAEVFLDQYDLDLDNNEASVVNDVIAEADVKILSFTATETPEEVMLGDSFDVTLTKIVTNLGISSPVDIDAKVDASGNGVSIVPSQVFPGVDEVEKDEEVELFEGEFTVTCEEFGVHEVVFSNEITPVDATDTDLSNNEAEIKIEVDCVIPVQINIHPASDPNSVNIIKKNGLIPVAILSTSAGEYGLPEDVDATMVDPLTVYFGPADVLFDNNPPGGATEIHDKGHIKDSYELDETTQDGDDDMVLHFKAKQSELDENDSEGCVKGKIDIGGMLFTFFGCDDISVPPHK